MGEFAITLFIFIAVMAVTLLLFGGWLTVMTVRLIGRALGAAVGLNRQTLESKTNACGDPKCRQSNPASARFCRRCGRALAGQQMGRITAA